MYLIDGSGHTDHLIHTPVDTRRPPGMQMQSWICNSYQNVNNTAVINGSL